MERLRIQEAFTKLKPHCDLLMRDPNVKNAEELGDRVKDVSDAVVQDLLDYILFPVIVHLQNEELSKDVKQHLVDSMRVVLSKTRIASTNTFGKLYACLLYQIYDKSQSTMVIPAHEELKGSVLRCLRDLLRRCTMDVIESFYVRDNAPKIGQGIYLCVSIAKTEKLRSLRLTAIETIATLSYVHDGVDASDTVLRARMADVIMLFLPGIASGLQEVALGSDIQAYKVTMMAIGTWGRIIALVMEDGPTPDVQPSFESFSAKDTPVSTDPLGMSLQRGGVVGMKKLMETASRSREWFDAAAAKLNVIMRALIDLTKHSHFKVRAQLAETVELLLTACTRNMKANFIELIEILISLSEDDVAEVSEVAREALTRVGLKCARGAESRPLIELLEENFYKLLTKLPRIIRTSEDAAQLSHLNQLAGYLRLLGRDRLPQVMTSVAHLRRLLLALVYVSELDCSGVSLLEDIAVRNIEETSNYYASRSWRDFKFIRESAAEEKLRSICRLLGELGDVGILVDSMLGMMLDMPQYRKELILLLNWIVNVPIKDSSAISLYKSIVDTYTMQDFWYLPFAVSKDVTLRQAQCNIIQCCLLMEGLGVLAEILEHEFQRFLLKTLYLVIERAGNRHSLISLVGLQTLEKYAAAMEHGSVADLLRANVDYFSYHVTMKLRRVERNPGALDVVAIVMRYSTMDVLPCLKEIVEDVLLQSNANFQERNSYSFLKVFHTFAVCMRRLIASESAGGDGRADEKSTAGKPAEDVIRNLLEHREAKKVADNLEDDDPGGTPADIAATLEKEMEEKQSVNDDFDEDRKPDPPPHVKMIEEVMKRSMHFLPSKDTERILIAMETLQEGLLILADWEDQLLPVVHQLWHPLVDRFRDPNPLVINRAWQLLNTLARVSKDFIRARTLKQVLPAISDFLIKSAKESYKKDSGSAYKFTQMYKLQRELLSQLGRTACDLKLHERELWKLLETGQRYLSAYQNPVLQECCVKLYQTISDYDADVVWVKCLSICSPGPLVPPDPTFRTIQLPAANSDVQNEYQKNVETITCHIQGKMAYM